MLILVIIIIVFVIGKFAFDNHHQGVKVNKEGGMVNKYSLLVDYILSGDSRARIIRQTVDLGVASAGGVTAFYLI